MKTKFYLLPIALACIFAGCDKGSEDNAGSEKIVNLNKVSIPDAQTLFIAGSTSTKSALGFTRANVDDHIDEGEMGAPKLYKITATGQTYEVEFLDNSGEIIPVETEYFVNLLGEFVLMRIHYENIGYDEQEQLVSYRVEMLLIVNLEDGSVVSVDNNSPYAQSLHDIISVCKSGGTVADFGMQKDKSGSVYFYTDVLNKIYKSGGGVSISQTSLNLGDNGLWLMNSNGDIWFNYYCRKVSGEFIDSDDKLDWHYYFVKENHPGNFFRFHSYYDDEASEFNKAVWRMFLYKYTPGVSKLERTVDLEVETNFCISPTLMSLTFINNRVVIASDWDSWSNDDDVICVIDNDNVVTLYDNSVNAFPRQRVGGLWPNDRIRISDNYIYDCASDWGDRSDPDRNKIRRFNPVDGSVATAYEAPSKCDITGYSVSKDDVMTITALEGATGNPVTFTVEVDGTVTEYKTYNNQTIYQLERLN